MGYPGLRVQILLNPVKSLHSSEVEYLRVGYSTITCNCGKWQIVEPFFNLALPLNSQFRVSLQMPFYATQNGDLRSWLKKYSPFSGAWKCRFQCYPKCVIQK